MSGFKKIVIHLIVISLVESTSAFLDDYFIDMNSSDSLCIFNNKKLHEGDIALSLPSKCVQLICHEGIVAPKYFFGQDTCGCCEFGGKLFQEGSQLPGICTRLYCRCGQWEVADYIHDCCNDCRVFGNANLKTFDTVNPFNYYKLDSPCTYSLTQRLPYSELDDWQYPEYGVYGSFHYCSDGICLTDVIFKDSPQTILKVNLATPDVVYVNDISTHLVIEQPMLIAGTSTSILTWRINPMCIRILGSQMILLQVCLHELRIWVHPSFTDKVGGLCGKYNLFDQDDFTSSTNEVYPLKYYPDQYNIVFAESWKTPWMGTSPSCIQQYRTVALKDCVNIHEISAIKEKCNYLLTWALQYANEHGYHTSLTEDFIEASIELCVAEACQNKSSLDGKTTLDSIAVQLFLYSLMVESRIVGEHEIHISLLNDNCTAFIDWQHI